MHRGRIDVGTYASCNFLWNTITDDGACSEYWNKQQTAIMSLAQLKVKLSGYTILLVQVVHIIFHVNKTFSDYP